MTLNAGVAVSIEKVNITIADVDAELELVVRLGKHFTRCTGESLCEPCIAGILAPLNGRVDPSLRTLSL